MSDRAPRRVRCAATTVRGTPCRAWAVRGSDPPRCRAHMPRSAERNACLEMPEHADVDLTQHIVDLANQVRDLSKLIRDAPVEEGTSLSLVEYRRLLALHGQLCSRLSRMLRDRQQLQGDDQTELDAAIQDALDLAGSILGVEL